MSERTDKVASVIHHAVAAELTQIPGAAKLTVTKIDVSPDLREATIWVGTMAASEDETADLIKLATAARRDLQEAVARQLTTKFVPRLTIRHDAGGEYADHISRLIRGL